MSYQEKSTFRNLSINNSTIESHQRLSSDDVDNYVLSKLDSNALQLILVYKEEEIEIEVKSIQRISRIIDNFSFQENIDNTEVVFTLRGVDVDSTKTVGERDFSETDQICS